MNNYLQNDQKENNIFSVSDYISILNEKLKSFQAKIVGEVSGLKIWPSGHVYFDLKDPNDNSCLNCIIWKSNYELYGVELENGMEIIVSGYPDIYPSRGKLSLIVKTFELKGEGALKVAYDKLKKKLADEGFFDEERKRPIPKFPQKIGLITSIHGAVIHDFIGNLGKFGFKIKFIDSRVEGQESVRNLLYAIRSFREEDIEALVIIRGGGSLQSLAAFDNEVLVREIIKFPVPVLTGIGHHLDIPLVALAADIAESTPTAIANLLNQSWENAQYEVDGHTMSIFNAFKNIIKNKQSIVKDIQANISENLNTTLNTFKNMENIFIKTLSRIDYSIKLNHKAIEEYSYSIFKNFLNLFEIINNKISMFWISSTTSYSYLFKNVSQRLDNMEKIINTNDPRRQLKLGYVIARKNERVIRKSEYAKIGELIDLEFIDGEIKSRVENINKKKQYE